MKPRNHEHFKVLFTQTECFKNSPVVYMQNLLNKETRTGHNMGLLDIDPVLSDLVCALYITDKKIPCCCCKDYLVVKGIQRVSSGPRYLKIT